jgi:hypothetical protein
MPRFASHIREAITINKKRRKIYASLTAGKTRFLSNTLIGLEYAVLPIAWYFDARARKYNKNGIRIILDDFVEMHVKPANNLIHYRNEFTDDLYHLLMPQIKNCLVELKKCISLSEIIKTSERLYKLVIESQKEYQVHLAMTLHLLESTLLIAYNGIKYSEQSHGKTETLTLQLIRSHLFALRFAVRFDKKANVFHREGVGIVVNDLPNIKYN